MLCSTRFARTTMARAFQRMRLLMRRSSSWSPGKSGSRRGGMVLAYGVFAVNGRSMPLTVACARRRSRISAATSGPLDSRTESSDSSHSWISTSSMPWGWVDNSLSMTSIGSFSFVTHHVSRARGRIYASGKENRIHRGEIPCTAGCGIFAAAPANRAPGAILERAAAVNDQSLAGDEFGTREKQYGVGDVVRCAGVAEGRELCKVRLPLRRILRHGDGARRDSVHPYFRRQ